MMKWIAVGLSLIGWSFAHAGEEESRIPMIEKSGDLLQVGVPLMALGLTFLLNGKDADTEEDSETKKWNPYSPVGELGFEFMHMTGSPRHDLALAIARTELTTYSLKYGIDAERPNGGSNSFPSGHTSVAFAGAEFIRKQYGVWWGIPAYLTAGYVGWSRVISNNHYPRDVLAGAAIGILSNHDFATVQLPFGSLSVSSGLLAPQPGFINGFDAPPPDSVAAAFTPPPATGLRFELRF